MPSQLEKRPAAPGSHKCLGCLVQVSVKDKTVPREGIMLLVVFIYGSNLICRSVTALLQIKARNGVLKQITRSWAYFGDGIDIRMEVETVIEAV